MSLPIYTGDVKILSIGEILWDVIGQEKYAGGAPFNLAYHASIAGAKAKLISRVSNDDQAAELLRKAQELGVDSYAIQRDTEYPTGIVTAEPQPDGNTHYVFPQECAWDHIKFGDKERELIDDATVVTFGTLAQRHHVSRSSIMAALASVPFTSTVFLDINLRSPFYSEGILRSSLNAANIVKVNQAEMTTLKSLLNLVRDDEAAAEQIMNTYEVDTLVITKGEKGACAWKGTEFAQTEGLSVKAVDTIGCGDAFAATFIVNLACNTSLSHALNEANVVASYVATRPGGTPSYTLEDINRFRVEQAEFSRISSPR